MHSNYGHEAGTRSQIIVFSKRRKPVTVERSHQLHWMRWSRSEIAGQWRRGGWGEPPRTRRGEPEEDGQRSGDCCAQWVWRVVGEERAEDGRNEEEWEDKEDDGDERS